jgi:hypothetical protein
MRHVRAGLARWGAWHATAAYCAIAVVATWPLARGLGRSVPAAPDEPLLAMWAIAWDCEQLLGILRGDLSRVSTFFDANVFHPAPVALAYSEHFIGQALQVLPIYAATSNPILCYNLLFLSTFVLSGVGTFLFVRELTGNAGAAFLAGVLFAFAPYRLAQSSQLQVLSAQWMPFVLYGLRRYFDAQGTRRALLALAGAAAGLVVLSLSSVHYLAFFPPFAGAYIAWEAAVRGAVARWRVWAPAAAACALAVALTVPAAVPYAAVRQPVSGARSRGEVLRHSADVYSYATAAAGQPVWGEAVRAFPKPGVELFPGFVPLLLLVAALTPGVIALFRRVISAHDLRRRHLFVIASSAVAAAHVAAIVAALLYRRVQFEVAFFDVSISNIDQLLFRAAVLIAIALALSPAARTAAAAVMRGPGFFVLALVAAVWLSFGPAPQALGRPVELVAPYALLHDHVPGWAALRIPSRFTMIAVLMLAVLGGLGAAILLRRRTGRIVVSALGLLFLLEALAPRFPVNAPVSAGDVNLPTSRVLRPARAPAVYAQIAALPRDSAIAELPIGNRALDLRAMFYSTAHWRPVLNGYGETAPPHYDSVVVALSDVPRQTEAALDALRATGATHVLVHEDAYLGASGTETTAALVRRGAAELFRSGADVLLALPALDP